MLDDEQIEAFVQDGFVRVESAFPRSVAAECRERLWEATGCDPNDATTWIRPVIRIGGLDDAPFQVAATTDRLHETFDQLVGVRRWLPRVGLGTFQCRQHSVGGYRINLVSRGRALLMLFLFSDVGNDDAPTRIRVGSHLRLPSLLAPYQHDGTSLAELPPLEDLRVVEAVGRAGDVYLCHPFLVHAAQPHRGSTPKFMAQPPLYPAGGQLSLDDPDAASTPVVRAILLGLEASGQR
jgi:hypothetical protein